MSADNYGYIAQDPITLRWHVLMGFASQDEMDENGDDTGPLNSIGVYASRTEAFNAAEGDYFEYGYSDGDWPTERVQ